MPSGVASSSMGASAPTASSLPGPAVEPSGPPPLLSSQASLYLYTFLVTLILLLTVSGAIVLRSFLMRRRHRRMVEEAIRNGTYVPPSRTKNQLGQKPVIYDAYLGVDDATDFAVQGKAKGRSNVPAMGEMKWEDILPVSALLLNPDGLPYYEFQECSAEKPSAASLSRQGRAWRSVLRWRPFRYLTGVLGLSTFPTPAENMAPTSILPTPTSPEQTVGGKAQLPPYARVSVMIAMPRPPQIKQATQPKLSPSLASPSIPSPAARLPLLSHEDDQSEPLPHMELGIADVQLGQWEEGDVQDMAGWTCR